MADIDPITALALSGIDADAQTQDLLRSQPTPKRLPFSMLYAYASDPSFDVGDTFRARLANDVRAQADLATLMARAAFAYIPSQAAASSVGSGVMRRVTAQATITLTPSRADTAQVYVIITLSNADANPPVRLTLKDRTGAFIDFDLGPFSAGRVQLLLATDSPVATALRDAETEVFLR